MLVPARGSAAPRPSRLSVPIEHKFDLPEMKVRQGCKIEELHLALLRVGALSLDQQAAALGLSRSTTWSILRATHKNSGLSANIINRMLASPQLPALIHQIILEYIQEKLAGLYGHCARRRREFAVSLSRRNKQLEAVDN